MQTLMWKCIWNPNVFQKKKVQYECVQLMECEINTVNRVNEGRKLLKIKISPNKRIQVEMHTSLGWMFVKWSIFALLAYLP